MSDLPPLGSRGLTPYDIPGLPVLPKPFEWTNPNYGVGLWTKHIVEVVVDRQRVALINPLVTNSGWLVTTGSHRDDLKLRHSEWIRCFDRAVDYVHGWVTKYHAAIAAEALERYERVLAQHRHRAPAHLSESK